MIIEKDDVVLVEYQITANSNPHENGFGKVKIGSNTLFKKIEDSLIGLSVNDQVSVGLKEEFGNYDNNLVLTISSSQLPPSVKIGDYLTDSNQRKLRVTNIYEDKAVIDYNNPLCGQEVLFNVYIKDIQKNNNKESLIFDIGYNHGNFTRELLLSNPNSKIIAVEAHPMYVDQFNQNPIPNVTLLNCIISDKLNEEVSFFICDSNPGINSINEKWISEIRHSHFFDRTKREVKMNSVTLDYLIDIYGIPDILKLDIEGAEFLALSGLTRKCGLILFEWCEECFEDTKKCLKILSDLGYTEFANDHHMEGDPVYSEYRGNLDYKSLDEILEIEIIPERKQKWGMIYAR